ncbi:MAG TPA: hypothetical protein VFG05_11485 [Methylocella sp.]|nr:hypothetical protein [Methylocella sp.]
MVSWAFSRGIAIAAGFMGGALPAAISIIITATAVTTATIITIASHHHRQ